MAGEKRTYHFLRYNHHGVLRPNAAFFLLLLFLGRHVLLLLLLGLSHGRSGQGPGNPELAALIDPVFIIADIPAWVLLFALGARLPTAGPAVRLIWRQGKAVMLAAISLFLALHIYRSGLAFAAYSTATWAVLAANLAAVAYIAASRYLRDLFAGFPAPASD
jgi:hypothetical protein